MESNAMKQKFDPEAYNDTGFAVAFVGQIAMVLVWISYAASTGAYTVAAGAPALLQVSLESYGGRHHASQQHDSPQHGGHQHPNETVSLQYVLLLILASVFFSLVWAAIWLVMLQIIPSQVVTVAILATPVIFGLLTVAALASGQLLGAGICGLLTALAAFWVYCVWDRIGFTSQVFKTASTCYSKSMSIFGVALVSVIAQAAWTLVWLLAVFPLVSGKSSGAAIAWPFLLLSYYWSCQVVANVLYVACSGVMARWYYGLQVDEAVSLSTKQACTHSFGSICFGSLLIAIIQTLRALCQQAQDQAEDDENAVGMCLACIAQAILGCIEDMVQIFNAYAFAYVAIYGLKFWDAGEQVFQLISDSGLEPLVHFSLVDTVSFFGTLTGGLFTGGLAAFLAFRIGLSGGFIFGVGCLGFLTGLAVMSVVSRIMDAGAITLFLCYAEEPSALSGTDAGLADLFNERRSLLAAKSS